MEIKHFDLIVDGCHGIYIPQIFARRFPEWLSDEEREVLLAGPEHEDYWETWKDVTRRAYEDQSLYLGESGDVFILTDSPMQSLIAAWESMEALDDCPSEFSGIVQKLAYEFLIDGDEFMSEDEALQHFLPFRYNDDLVNKALAWINTRLKEERQP